MSNIGLDAVTSEWCHFEGTYRLTADTPGVDLSARLIAEGKNVSSTLQLPAHDAVCPLPTSSASTSEENV